MPYRPDPNLHFNQTKTKQPPPPNHQSDPATVTVILVNVNLEAIDRSGINNPPRETVPLIDNPMREAELSDVKSRETFHQLLIMATNTGIITNL